MQTNLNNTKNVTIGHYILGKPLGKGTFGQVKQGTHILTGEKVAVKILEKEKINDQKDVERITREIKILKKVRHPNVIQLYEIIETEKELFMIMEHANGGELFDFIVRNTRLNEQQAAKFYWELIGGIEYLHKSGVCHRDLKPENLLLDYDNTLKIVDFGLSNMYEKSETLKTACGSPCYAAPEMIAGKRYHGLQTDIWSSGVVFYAMVAGYLPFEDPKTSNLYKKIMAAEYTMPKFLSPECKDFVQKILNTDPETRIRIADIRNHPYMRGAQKEALSKQKETGLFPGLQKMPYGRDLLTRLINDFQFEEEYSIRCLEANRHNHITATYHLINKKNQRNTYMRETFSTRASETAQLTSKRERLQSQGASKKPAITLENVKPPARKVIQDEMNQTMTIPSQSPKPLGLDTLEGDENTMSQIKRESGSEVPKQRRDIQTIEYGENGRFTQAPSPSVPATTNATTGRERVKGEIIRSRITKQSQSPDKYHLNNNLVVQLADPIRKPADMKTKMYQTSYKTGTKASFFPSTATATTNGSSNNDGSQDPRRTTEGGSRTTANSDQTRFQKPQSRQQNNSNNNGSFELNLPLRFGKNQIKRNIPVQSIQSTNTQQIQSPGVIESAHPGISQTTKNAWQAIEFNQRGRDVNGTFAINSAASNNSGISGVHPAVNPQQSIFLGNQAQQKVGVRAQAAHLASVNVSTKLQQQLLTLPDASKNSQSVKARHSPRDYGENGQRKHQFYAIQGKGMNIHNDQKKSILNKLFKNGAKINAQHVNHSPGHPAVTNNYTTVNSSFNEQLMNQTNFGFNPARGTIVSTPNSTGGGVHPQRDIMHIEPMNKRELNTQKRNRTQTIQIESPMAANVPMHQRGGSLNIHELYQHYHQKPKGTSVPAQRIANHQAASLQSNNVSQGPTQPEGVNFPLQSQQAQLFLPGTMKMQVVARKSPATQHQQHRSHSVNNQGQLQVKVPQQ